MNELVMIGGMPAGGKTTVTKRFTEKGYTRLNRDLEGGKVDDLLPKLKAMLAKNDNVVMDNLYATKDSRAGAIKIAKTLGVPVNFVLMDTSLEDAQFNACLRMMKTAGHVLHPEEHKYPEYKDNPNLFPVVVLYKYRKEFQRPSTDEGFANIATEHFKREFPVEWVNKAVIFDFDGTLRTHVGNEKYPCKKSEVRALPGRTKKMKEYAKNGYLLLGASNQSGIAKGNLSEGDAIDCFNETLKQLGLLGGIFPEVRYCPHKVPPITCYCRKPNVGMAVELIVKYCLDPRQVIYVGDMTTDKTFAQRSGFKFIPHDEFFR